MAAKSNNNNRRLEYDLEEYFESLEEQYDPEESFDFFEEQDWGYDDDPPDLEDWGYW